MTMSGTLFEIYNELLELTREEHLDGSSYSVLAVPNYRSYFVGIDGESNACLLITTIHQTTNFTPPIRLKNLEVQFELRCHVKNAHEAEHDGNFTVIRCRDKEMARYFLFVADSLISVIGDHPSPNSISKAVQKLASIFQKTRNSPTRTLTGLFGELYILLRSKNTETALSAWRANDSAMFDFSYEDIRIDVKTTGSKSRSHYFSYEQCNPPHGTIAVVASLRAELNSTGMSFESIISQIEERIETNFSLVFKLHETIATTLGSNLSEDLSQCFDLSIAKSSLLYYDLKSIPAIRIELPNGVGNVRFSSDLTASRPIAVKNLIEFAPAAEKILP